MTPSYSLPMRTAAERNRKWDQQIEGDAHSGQLRELYERLQSENQGQSTVTLDESLDDEEIPRS